MSKGFAPRPNLSREQVYLEKGCMPKRSYILVSHVFEISFSLLEPDRRHSQAYFRRLFRESYYRLMQEFDLKTGVYEDTWYVMQIGAWIRTDDSKPPLNVPNVGELETQLPHRESSDVASSSAPSQSLAISTRPILQTITNFSDPQYSATLSPLDSSSANAFMSTLAVREPIIERNSDGPNNLHRTFTSSPQPESSQMVHQASQPVPSISSNPTNIDIDPTNGPSQLQQLRHLPQLDLKRALSLISNPLSRFPRYVLETILFIGTQPWGKLFLYDLVLLACYQTGTLKFGILAIKGLDGWLETLGNWSAPRYFNIARGLGRLIKVWGRLTSPVLMRVVKEVGGLLKNVGLWAVRKIVRRK
ncbi:hypothetical protein EAE96_007464 [Botrytis aclada]|nr:hypothetical protein EAE96_007464 [Botrytis aclada]